MTDIGHTGFQVAPEVPTEDEMKRVQSILERAVNAVVSMSQLKADVDMLRQTVASLQADMERLRNQNNALDEALNHSRSVRDELSGKVSDLTTRLNSAEAEREIFRNSVNDLSFAKSKLEADLAQARKERDDHGLQVMQLEDDLKAAQAKLDKIAEIFGAMQSTPSVGQVIPITDWTHPDTPLPVSEPPPIAPEPSADEAHKPQEPVDTHPWWEKEGNAAPF